MPKNNFLFSDEKEKDKYFNYAKRGHLSDDDSEARANYALAFWNLLHKVAPKMAKKWGEQLEQMEKDFDEVPNK